MLKISMIVPIYNMADYLEQCIKSITAQTEKNLEIILVNNGSTDCSAEICKKYESVDKRIIYIEVENCGVGPARNIGMMRATGEWLCFVDSDDYLPEDAVEKLLKGTDEVDIVIGNYFTNKNGKITREKFVMQGVSTGKKQHIEDEIGLIGNALGSPYYGAISTANIGVPWARLYRKQFCMEAGLLFPPIKRMQDTLFNISAFQKTNKICFINENVYYYRVTEKSAVHRYTPDFNVVTDEILRYLKEIFIINEEKKISELYVFKKLGLLIENIRLLYMHPLCQKTKKEKIKGIQSLCKDYGVKRNYGVANKKLFSRKQKIILTLLSRGQYSVAYYFFYANRYLRG